jgi:hypothetical protein
MRIPIMRGTRLVISDVVKIIKPIVIPKMAADRCLNSSFLTLLYLKN